MKTINDLKAHLQNILDNLEERFDGEEELQIVHNTYWIHSNNFISTGQGFICLINPTGHDEEDDEY